MSEMGHMVADKPDTSLTEGVTPQVAARFESCTVFRCGLAQGGKSQVSIQYRKGVPEHLSEVSRADDGNVVVTEKKLNPNGSVRTASVRRGDFKNGRVAKRKTTPRAPARGLSTAGRV